MGARIFLREATGLVKEISPHSALVYNMVAMGLPFMFIYTTWSLILFPGAYLPLTALYAIPLGMLPALVYYLMSAAMPRSGGDYVWISRLIHPGVGLMTSFALTFVLLVAIGVEPSWALQWGIAPIFYSLAILNGDPSYLSLAQEVSSPLIIQLAGLAYFALIALVLSRGTRTFIRIQWALFILSALGAAAFVVALLWEGHAGFVQRFDALSGMKYQEILREASQAGYPMAFDAKATGFSIVYTFLTLAAFWFTAYIGGEIKNIRRAQLIAIPGSLTLLSLAMYVVYAAMYAGFDGIFLGSLSYLSAAGSASYRLPFNPPFPHFLTPFLTDNILLIALVDIGFAVTPLAAGLAYIFLVTRNIFAWAFDRLVPGKLAEIHPRYGSPYYASVVIIAFSMLFQALWLYTSIFQYLLYITTILFIVIWIASFAALLLPFRRRQLFEALPRPISSRLGGVPILMLLALGSIAVSSFIIYATLNPLYGGVLDPRSLFYNLLIFPVGLLAYYVSRAYNRRRGVPLDLIFAQLPPE